MRKATLKDIPSFYKHERYIDDEGNKGYMYYLSEQLSNNDKNILKEKYNNIDFYIVSPEYAPEIKTNIIFLSDNVMKK